MSVADASPLARNTRSRSSSMELSQTLTASVALKDTLCEARNRPSVTPAQPGNSDNDNANETVSAEKRTAQYIRTEHTPTELNATPQQHAPQGPHFLPSKNGRYQDTTPPQGVAIPRGHEHGSGGTGRARGRGRADLVHYIKQGYPVRIPGLLRCFRLNVFCYSKNLKKYLRPKMQNERYFQRFEPGTSRVPVMHHTDQSDGSGCPYRPFLW